MTEIDSEAADVIESYRKRKERLVPLILGGLAIVLLVVGIFFVVLWFTGDSPPALPGFLASNTPTPTVTNTPRPPTATPTVTLTLAPTLTPTPSGPIVYIVELGDTLSSIAEKFGVEIVLLMSRDRYFRQRRRCRKIYSPARISNIRFNLAIPWKRSPRNSTAQPMRSLS